MNPAGSAGRRAVWENPVTLAPETLLGHSRPVGTILADPPWRFANRTGKMPPEHRRLHRYRTMTVQEICSLPVARICAAKSHLYLWCPNALLAWGLRVLEAWGFAYKTNIVWLKIRKDGGPDGRGVGFYYRNVTELVLFGTRGQLRTLQPGRRMVNLVAAMKAGHSRKPDELYDMIEQCSPGPFLELFARYPAGAGCSGATSFLTGCGRSRSRCRRARWWTG